MKKGLFVFAILSLFFVAQLASASVVNFNFDMSQNATIQHPGLIHTDSVVLQVSTNQNALCRYSTSKGTSFNLMQSTFEDNLEIIHKKAFTRLSDGVYRYYVRCRHIDRINNDSEGLNELEAVFRINNPIAGQVTLEKDVLSPGKYEVKLTTTKIPISAPKLSFTYDDVSYTPIVLQGSDKSWKGQLIIPDSPIEETGRFRLEARDLENRLGSKLTGDTSFEVDTKSPQNPQFVEATGEYGQVRLRWHVDDVDDVEKVRVYRTQNPPVKLTDLHRTITGSKESYTDTETSSGKTYYYRISFEDKAGNLAELSREVVATTLLSNSSSRSSALSPQLAANVDKLITEIELLKGDIERSKAKFSSQDSSSKEYLELLGVGDSINSALSGVGALNREVSDFKSQDFSKEVLDAKLASARSRMNILRKGVPDSFTVFETKNAKSKLSSDTLRTAILTYAPELDPDSVDLSVSESLSQVEDLSVGVDSSVTSVEVIYTDGSKESNSIVEHKIRSNEDLSSDTKLVLKLPQGIVSGSRIKMMNADYSEENEDVFSFEFDTKKITYRVDKKVSEDLIKEIDISPVRALQKESILTGYFLSELPGSGSLGVVFLIILASSLGVYLLYVRGKSKKGFVEEFIDKARQVKDLKRQGRIEESNALYTELKADYLGLSAQEKSAVFKEVKHLMVKK